MSDLLLFVKSSFENNEGVDSAPHHPLLSKVVLWSKLYFFFPSLFQTNYAITVNTVLTHVCLEKLLKNAHNQNCVTIFLFLIFNHFCCSTWGTSIICDFFRLNKTLNWFIQRKTDSKMIQLTIDLPVLAGWKCAVNVSKHGYRFQRSFGVHDHTSLCICYC